MFRYTMMRALSQEISKSLLCLVENLTWPLWELTYGSSHSASLTYRVVLMQKCIFHISPWIKLVAQGEKLLLCPFFKRGKKRIMAVSEGTLWNWLNLHTWLNSSTCRYRSSNGSPWKVGKRPRICESILKFTTHWRGALTRVVCLWTTGLG